MNVISWENGDTEITHFPKCSDNQLARLVQQVNDSYCSHKENGEYGYLLCAGCSIEVLALAHRTVGTADAYEKLTEAQKMELWKAVYALPIVQDWNHSVKQFYDPTEHMNVAHAVIDFFEQFTQSHALPVSSEVTARAVSKMLVKV